MSNKKHVKRFRDLLKVLETCSPSESDFKKYLKLYVDVRRAKLKSRLNSSSSSIDNPIELSLSDENKRMSVMSGTGG